LHERLGSFTGITRSTTWSSSVNTAALAPIAERDGEHATVVKSGDLRRLRSGEVQVAEQRHGAVSRRIVRRA
jgi:hypothetical protein